MTMRSVKRDLYDADEYSEKMRAMIANIRSTTPGAAVGKVGKNDVLIMFKKEIQQLIDDGYTVKQVAQAMQSDVFNVLPKTITQVLRQKVSKRPLAKSAIRVQHSHKNSTTVDDTANQGANKESPTFDIAKDQEL